MKSFCTEVVLAVSTIVLSALGLVLLSGVLVERLVRR